VNDRQQNLRLQYDLCQRYGLLARVLEAAFPSGTVAVLDVGAGADDLSRAWLPDRFAITLADASTFGRSDITLLQPGEPLPFRDRSFDAVLAMDVLEHMPAANRDGLVREFARVAFGEGIGLVAVDVENADEPPAPPDDRQHDFRPGGGGAGDVAGERLHIGDDLHLAGARGRAADAPLERDDEAAVAALVGADLQEAGFGDAVEARPVEAIVGMVQFAHDRCHERDLVGLSLGQAFDGAGKRGVVSLHGVSSLRQPGHPGRPSPLAHDPMALPMATPRGI